LSETLLVLRRIQQDIIINVYTSECKNPCYTCHILIKLEFSGQIFKKMLKYQILLTFVQCEPSCSMRTEGQTDRHDEGNSLFAQSCERA